MLVVASERYLGHGVSGHPERPQRLQTLVAALRRSGPDLEWAEPRPATDEELLRVHSKGHLAAVRALDAEGGWFDPDTYAVPGSEAVARLAAGGVLTAVEEVLAGRHPEAFAAVRPPGHHATRDRAMGFCLYNNVAAAARHAQARGVERVLVADIDVHHGNGTQEIFFEDASVLYLSIHRFPFYPGTGRATERGEGAAEGTNVNLPFAASARPEEIVGAFGSAFREAVAGFRPGLVLVSAGFDGYEGDPIGGLNLRPRDYAEMGRILREPSLPLVSALEGGYDLDGLARCVLAYLQEGRRNGSCAHEDR